MAIVMREVEPEVYKPVIECAICHSDITDSIAGLAALDDAKTGVVFMHLVCAPMELLEDQQQWESLETWLELLLESTGMNLDESEYT